LRVRRSAPVRADVLVIIAHPDDEIFVSGTLCLLSEKFHAITLVCVTDGEGGSRELLRHLPPGQKLGEIRRQELKLSATALGISDVVFFAAPDIPPDDWGEAASWDTAELTAALEHMVREATPALILTHGPRGGYGHPAHCEVYRCVMAAAERAAFAGSIFSFAGQVTGAFFSWRFDDRSDVLVDGRSFLRRRIASLCYHQSAIEFFLAPWFPRTLRAALSALAGFALAFAEAGRKRIPIVTPARYFRRCPIEGLVLRRSGSATGHFFMEHYADDPRVRLAPPHAGGRGAAAHAALCRDEQGALLAQNRKPEL
jgi:LmbE family N-acetylglucosaminyl deacetylase